MVESESLTTDILLIVAVSIIVVFLIMDIYFYQLAKTQKISESHGKRTSREIEQSLEEVLNKRINVIFATFISIGLIIVIIEFFVNSNSLGFLTWICAIIIFYTLITSVFVERDHFRIFLNKEKNKPFIISLSLFLTLIMIILISSIKYGGFIYSASVFESADWFSESFLDMVSDPKVQGVVSLIIIGTMTIMMGKARNNSNFMVSGYFLVIMLPIFSIFDSFFTDIDSIQDKARAIYNVFQSEALSLVIYIFIQIIFYTLLTSIALAFIKMVEPIETD